MKILALERENPKRIFIRNSFNIDIGRIGEQEVSRNHRRVSDRIGNIERNT